MRWERLFEDLESQWDAQARRELDSEVADRTRRERAAVGLLERLAAHRDQQLAVRLVTGHSLEGEVRDVGDGWLLLAEAAGRTVLVPLHSVVALTGLDGRALETATARRFGLGYALRGLSRDRCVVAVADRSGLVVTGTVDGVGADACDLSEHAADQPRRPENVVSRRVVPFSAIVWVRQIA